MQRKEITDFNIKIDKSRVLHTLGCFEGSTVYNTVAAYFDELNNKITELFTPRAAIAVDNMKVYCLITLGDAVSEYSQSFFDCGEGMKGMLADAIADEYLFGMDEAVGEYIKHMLAAPGYGVKSRLDAPKDFPLSEQRVILEKTGLSDVSITSAFMFNPVKTMGYVLELTEDTKLFNAQHDCSKCTNFDCPRRSSGGSFEVLSSYEYTPQLTNTTAVCIDIGTTTVAFELLNDKGTIRTYKTVNPQRRFGTDVLSRIEAANRGRLDELSSDIKYTLLRGIGELTKDFGGIDKIDKIVIAGNTTMVHLLLGASCASLGEYPFKSKHLDTVKTTLDKLTDSSAAPIETVICGGISAFVGGDIVSGLYMCDFDKSDDVNIFIDLGTNGEMAIGNREKILTASTAAGPAFEGGRISCGAGSVDGAICGVDLKNNILKTIADKPPIGLCGTGIIELVSELIDEKIIDNTGLMSDDYFVLGYKVTGDVVFTQSDVRQVQMAKSAVRAGVEVLIKSFGISPENIGTVYLAGGFGYGLSIEKACNMGILPPEFIGKTKVLGNSSLGGCAKYCSESNGDERINHIKSLSQEVSLANSEEFQKLYIDYMNF